MVKDLTEPWNSFEEKIKESKEKCFAALISLLDDIRQELAGKPPRLISLGFLVLIIDCVAAEPGVDVLAMAPFLKSLAPKKKLIRKHLESFSRKVERVVR